MNRVIILLCCFQLISCKNNVQSQEPSADREAYTYFVNTFYEWYLNKIYKVNKGEYFMPGYLKLNDKKYVFNIKPVSEKFRKACFFSEDFIKNDSIKIANCNKEMLKEIWDEEPEPEFNIQPCNFLWKDRIIGGQGENLDNFKIVSITLLDKNSAMVNVDIYEKGKRAYSSKVKVVDIGNHNLKIDSIDIEYVKYK